MRPFVIFLCAGLTLACTQEQSRPAKEAVAEAKGTAAEAEKTAQQAAADADRTVNNARVAVEQGVATAEQKTRSGVDAVATGVRELGEGGVVTGRVSTVSRSHLALRPEGSGPGELQVDQHTRFLLHGEGLEKPQLAGRRVRATYVVEAHVPVATEVEVLTP